MRQRDDDIRERVLGWYAKAEEDFDSAVILLSHQPPVLGPVGFHSQQCAEKYLKAFLAAQEIEPPKIHSIGALLDLIARVDPALAESLENTDRLSVYGVGIRYPFRFPDMSPALAKEAFDLASKVRDAVRERLDDFLGRP